MPEDNEKRESLEVVKTGARALARQGSALVRRGLEDLSTQAADQWFEKGYDSWVDCDHADAVACFDKAIEVYPAHVYAWYCKGWSLEILGRLTDSIESFDRCLEIDPSRSWALNGKGRVLAKLGRFEEALDCYDAANQLGNLYDLSEKGKVLYELGRYDEAIHGYDESLNLEDEDDDVVPKTAETVFKILSSKADALLKLRRFEEAVSCCNESLSHLSFDVFSAEYLFSVVLTIFFCKLQALMEFVHPAHAVK